MWYKEAPKKSFIGRRVIAWNSLMHKRGTVLIISGWHDTYPGLLFVKEIEDGERTTIHASRVRLLNSNEDAVGLLRGE
jgi:hypothetical protein